MKLQVVIEEVSQSESFPTSVQVNCTGGVGVDELDADNIQSLFSAGGNTRIVLFLRNMLPADDEAKAEKVLSQLEKKLVGKTITVQHFVFAVSDILEDKASAICTDGYESGLSSLVYNTANLDLSEDEAKAAVTAQVKSRLADGTYWLPEDEQDGEDEPEEEKKPQKPQRRGRR